MKRFIFLIAFTIGLSCVASACSDEKAFPTPTEVNSQPDNFILAAVEMPSAINVWFTVLEYPHVSNEVAKSSKHIEPLIKPPSHLVFNPYAYSMVNRCF
jgi:hypothetical protein